MALTHGRGNEFFCQKNHKAAAFADLKARIHAQEHTDTARLSLGLGLFDRALSGGFACQHVHLVTGPCDQGSASGFVLALLRRQMAVCTDQPVIWCAPDYGGRSGQLCAEGIRALGLDPGRFIFVHENHPVRLMGAFEEALQTTGIAGIVAEYAMLASKADQWSRWAQRLRRAARAGSAVGFLLGPPAPSASFESSWSVTPGTDYQDKYDWRPCWSVSLEASRTGRPHAANVIYDPLSGRLSAAVSDSAPTAASDAVYMQRHAQHRFHFQPAARQGWDDAGMMLA